MKFTVVLLLSCLSTLLSAQGIGLHPPEVDWQQLRAANARIIFPEGYEGRAQRVASLIDRLAAEHNRSVGDRLYDFDLVLQTPNMTINGYVGLGPFRSEFYVTPPQGLNQLSTADWVDLLTIHEFRHVQQTSNERRGLTALGNALQGQLGWAVLSNLATPNWFSEGDAVIAETALTASGRGRTPAFSKDLRALLDRDIVYNYARARNGSYRKLVPDHYRYGYALLTYARERFGNDVWKTVLHEGAAYRSLLYPFSRALKRQTGLTTRELYRTTMADLEAAQDSFLKGRQPLVRGRPVGSEDSDIRNYRFPFVDGQGRLLALRSSFRQLPALVEVGEDGDRVITRPGIQREPWLDGGNRLVIWTETRQHPRYTNRSYSELVLYELGSGRKRILTDGGHYVSASLSFDERQIVAVYFDPLAGGPELHLFDAARGLLQRRRTIDEVNVSWPRFSPDGKTVYFFGQDYAGVAIEAWNLDTDAVTTVKERSPEAIDMLRVTPAGELLYTSGRDGVDNVYQLAPAAGPQRLTNVAVGAYYPVVAEDKLFYSAPTPRGDRLNVLSLDRAKPAGKLAAGGLSPAAENFFQRSAAYAAESVNLSVGLEEQNYPTENFSNTFGGIRLHSWSYNGSYTTPGLAVTATNALSTVQFELEGQYNLNEARYSGGVEAVYGGLFPIISVAGNFRDRNTVVQEARTDSLRLFRQEFNQLTLGPTVSVPLRWVAGNFVTSVTPSVGYQYYAVGDANEGQLPDNFGNLSLDLSFSALQRIAYRQVQSRLGLTTRFTYDRALGGVGLGQRQLLRTSLFLPGAFLTHGIRLDFDVQEEQGENLFQYPDIFRYARGYDAPFNDRVYRIGVNYQLPLLYPDFGILGITYFKRVRLNGFYDYSQFTIDSFDATINESSVGGQLFFDNVWLNAQELTVGVQFSYLLDPDLFSSKTNRLRVQLLFSGSF